MKKFTEQFNQAVHLFLCGIKIIRVNTQGHCYSGKISYFLIECTLKPFEHLHCQHFNYMQQNGEVNLIIQQDVLLHVDSKLSCTLFYCDTRHDHADCTKGKYISPKKELFFTYKSEAPVGKMVMFIRSVHIV